MRSGCCGWAQARCTPDKTKAIHCYPDHVLPALEGVIRRRILLNFRVDADAVAHLVPEPLEVLTYGNFAIVGVCLIGMEQLRPKGLPSWAGLSSENMAHRIAIRYPTSDGMRDGVFIWRRDTDQCLVTLLGGRLFPGVHQHATFSVAEQNGISIDVRTQDGTADVRLDASPQRGWDSNSVFSSFDEAVEFFRRGDCGFSCSLREGKLDGLQLKTLRWEMSPLHMNHAHSAFFQDPRRFPGGKVQFDCALIMRGIPHEWHEISDLPEFAGTITE